MSARAVEASNRREKCSRIVFTDKLFYTWLVKDVKFYFNFLWWNCEVKVSVILVADNGKRSSGVAGLHVENWRGRSVS